jgi:hypothetical protein
MVGEREPMFDLFVYFINERQRIYLKKIRGEKQPYTSDEILSKYRFTNVFREQDPGTIIFIESIKDLPDETKLRASMIYRVYCRPEFRTLFEGFNEQRIIETIKSSPNPLSGCYFSSVLKGLSKYDILDYLLNVPLTINKCAKEQFKILRKIKGFGDFRANQVILDMMYFYVRKDDFIMLGNGSKKGLELVGMKTLKEVLEKAQEKWEHEKPLDLAAIEHSLCEFTKYVRGSGRRYV